MRSREEIKGFLKDIQTKNLGMVERAKAFAEFAHAGQLDKGSQAYIYHPTRVAQFTAEKYNDDILTAVAYMHDVVEDGGFTVSDLSLFFPVAVWKTVELLTRGKSDGRDVYINRIGENLLATKVKLMDLKDNMDLSRLTCVTEKDSLRQDRYVNEYWLLDNRLLKMEESMTPEEMESETYADLYM
jgi:(p)ppGpp synthase/HD superfamily hydrolase